jgi:integrase
MTFRKALDAASAVITSNQQSGATSAARTREYLTAKDVRTMMAAARKSGRYNHRDATMLLIASRHGIDACELCSLQWHQVDLAAGRLLVRRSKRGTPNVHPIQGDEIRALRRLQRGQSPSLHVFPSERGGPMALRSFQALISRLGRRAGLPFAIRPNMLRHACGFGLLIASHDNQALQAWLGNRKVRRVALSYQQTPI